MKRHFQAGLRFIENPVTAHCEKGTICGEIKQDEDIYLTNEQAIGIKGDSTCVIE